MTSYRNAVEPKEIVTQLKRDSEGKVYYDLWLTAKETAFKLQFGRMKQYLTDPNTRDKWMIRVFEDPTGEQEKPEAFSYSETPMSPTNTNMHQTPSKENRREEEQRQLREMIRRAATMVIESITVELLKTLNIGATSPWERAVTNNDYDALTRILKQEYQPRERYPMQTIARDIQQMSKNTCETIENMHEYLTEQEKIYYKIMLVMGTVTPRAEINQQMNTPTYTLATVSYMQLQMIAIIMEGMKHPVPREAVQKLYQKNKTPKNINGIRKMCTGIQEDNNIVNDQTNHATTEVKKGKRSRTTEESSIKSKRMAPVITEEPKIMCKDYWLGQCNNPSCERSHQEKDRILCGAFPTARGCRFGDRCMFAHKKKKIPNNKRTPMPGGNRNAASTGKTKEVNRKTTDEGYNVEEEEKTSQWTTREQHIYNLGQAHYQYDDQVNLLTNNNNQCDELEGTSESEDEEYQTDENQTDEN